jgi:isopenicillin N synthase-like dioxygenase
LFFFFFFVSSDYTRQGHGEETDTQAPQEASTLNAYIADMQTILTNKALRTMQHRARDPRLKGGK